MRGLPYTPNAIWWAQMHLLGGPAKLFMFSAAYLALLVGAAVGFRHLNRSVPISTYCDSAILILTIVQSLLVIPGACNAVFRAFSRDVNTRMLESHRMSPSSSAGVICGYLLGPNIHLLSMYAIGVVVGTVIIRWGSIGVVQWICGSLYMLLVAPLIWAVTLLVGMGRKKPVNPSTILFLVFICYPLILSSPGVGMLSGVYAGYVGTRMMMGSTVVSPPAAAFLLLVAVGMTLVWSRAAMRRFRRPDLPAFDVVRGLGMLVIWLCASTLGTIMLDESTLRSMGAVSAEMGIHFKHTALIVAATGGMIVALLPISAVAHARCALERNDSPSTPRDRAGTNGTPFLCAVLVMAFTVPPAADAPWESIVIAGVSVWASLVTLEGLLRFAYSRKRRAATLVIVFLLIVWAAPPLADLWYGEITSAGGVFDPGPAQTQVFGLSPVGSVAKLFFGLDYNARPGLIVQLFFAAVGWAVGVRSLRRLRART